MKSQFYLSFWRSNIISCEMVPSGQEKSQVYLSFWRSNIISCERVAIGRQKSQFYFTVFGDRTSFRAKVKGLRLDARNRNFTSQFLAIEPHFVRKRCAGTREIAILPQVLAVEPHFVRKGCAGHLQIAILHQFLAIEPHFVRKGCVGRFANRNFTSVFGDRTSFRAKGLRFVPSRWHCPAPSREK